jgi:hypothetical protein
MPRSRSTSRTRGQKKSPSKSPSAGRKVVVTRKSDSEVVVTAAAPKSSPGRTKSPGRGVGRPKSTAKTPRTKSPSKSPTKSPRTRTKSPSKSSTRTRSPSKTSTQSASSASRRSRSRSNGSRGTPKTIASQIIEKSSQIASTIGDKSSRLASTALDKSKNLASSIGDKFESSVSRKRTPSHNIKDESPQHTPDSYHRRSPSPIFSSTRPRRAAASAGYRDLQGTESARYLNTRRVEASRPSGILPSVSWPKWTRNIRNHFRRHSTFYSVLLTILIGLTTFYLFGKQIQKQLHLIRHSLEEIYEEQRQRFDTMFMESPTEKAARENALPPPPPPNHERAPVKPPNPHIPKVPKGVVEPPQNL